MNDGKRINVPSWLANPEAAAPCLCGKPLLPGQPHIMAEGELGMRRWFHVHCWNMFMDDSEWEDDDED